MNSYLILHTQNKVYAVRARTPQEALEGFLPWIGRGSGNPFAVVRLNPRGDVTTWWPVTETRSWRVVE